MGPLDFVLGAQAPSGLHVNMVTFQTREKRAGSVPQECLKLQRLVQTLLLSLLHYLFCVWIFKISFGHILCYTDGIAHCCYVPYSSPPYWSLSPRRVLSSQEQLIRGSLSRSCSFPGSPGGSVVLSVMVNSNSSAANIFFSV